MGKVVQCFMILSDSLDFQKGESLAEQLNELYDYCVRTVKGYLTEKDVTKLEEVLSEKVINFLKVGTVLNQNKCHSQTFKRLSLADLSANLKIAF